MSIEASPSLETRHIENFSAGRIELHPHHESFLPELINTQWTTDDSTLHSILDRANRNLGALNAYTRLLPEADFFIRMHLAKEALASCSLDGINISLSETLSETPETSPASKGAWLKIRNLIAAQKHSIYSLEKSPLSNRLLKETHAILEAHSPQETRGVYREEAVLGNSSFAHSPPISEHLAKLMADLKNFIYNPQIQTPHIIKAALVLYQFETIKPFSNGNRRLSRLLVLLYLVGSGVLEKPALFFSDFLDRHRSEYEERITSVRERNDLLGWVTFFARGIDDSARRALDSFEQVRSLRSDIERRILPKFTPRRREKALKLMLLIYEQPVVNIKLVSKVIEAQINTATQLIEDFVEHGILAELTGYRRNRLFIFRQYVSIYESPSVLAAV